MNSIKYEKVVAPALTSHRFCFKDGSGFWLCEEENRLSCFGEKGSLMYQIMECAGNPLVSQGTEILQKSIILNQ